MIDDSVYTDSMKEICRVVDIKDGVVLVEKERTSACGACPASENCPLIGHPSHPNLNVSTVRVRVANPKNIEVKKGDEVLVEMKGRWITTKLSLIVYVFPLSIFLVGIFLGEYTIFKIYPFKDLYSTLLGTIFMLLSFFIVRIVDHHFAKVGKFLPVLVRKVNK